MCRRGHLQWETTDADIYKLLSENLDWERSWIEDEQPTHEVYLDGFWIDKYEVTNALYAICVAGWCMPSTKTAQVL